MTNEEYRLLSNRTRPPNPCSWEHVTNATLGVAGEAGEVVECIKKALFHAAIVPPDALKLEIGDLLFYIDWLADINGFTLEEAMYANVKKLSRRWPNGFGK